MNIFVIVCVEVDLMNINIKNKYLFLLLNNKWREGVC